MTDRTQRGLSTRHLIMFFLAGVAVCGVFFALGFLVGYNQRPSAAAQIETERLAASSAVPPTVNPRPTAHPQTAEETPSDDSQVSAPAPAPSPLTEAAAEARARSEAVKPKKGSRPAREVAETNLEDARSPAGAASSAGSASSALVIQLAASSARQDADTLVGALKTRGYSAFTVTPEQAKLGDKLYRVEVGPFSTRDEAEKVRQKLVKEGFRPFIRRQ
ncbi:MAG TPA: SPOR domain-containing protein [Terriglobia bacterium]|nr:SPOR domain-containing protein [Terriglobia bacterium]